MGRFSRIQNTTTTSNIPQSQTFCAVRARSSTYSDLGSSQTSFYIGLKWLTLNTFRYFNFYSVVAQQGRGPPRPRLVVRNLGIEGKKTLASPAENRVLAPLETFQTDVRGMRLNSFSLRYSTDSLTICQRTGTSYPKEACEGEVYMSYFQLSFLLMRRREGNTTVKDWTVSRYPRSDRDL